MIVCFPYAFDGRDTDEHRGIASTFIEQAMCHGEVVLVQLADENTARLPGVHECLRWSRRSFAQWYFDIMENFPYQEFLKIEYDVIMRRVPSEVFEDKTFEVAVPRERKGILNAGIHFCRERQFYRVAHRFYEKETNQDNWNAIQVALQMTVDCGHFRVKKLDWDIYGRVPDRAGDWLPDTSLVHFKDARKDWMHREYGDRNTSEALG